jgi:DNA-binding transcriptional regulator YdaS (Cro superfamily)
MKLHDYIKTTTQAEFANLLGVTQGCVWQWLNSVIKVTAERAIQIEKATKGKVTRAELRPDLFGKSVSPETHSFTVF